MRSRDGNFCCGIDENNFGVLGFRFISVLQNWQGNVKDISGKVVENRWL